MVALKTFFANFLENVPVYDIYFKNLSAFNEMMDSYGVSFFDSCCTFVTVYKGKAIV